MNIADKIKLRVDLDELDVLVGITSVIPADSIDIQYRAVFSIMLKVNIKLSNRLVSHRFNKNKATKVSIGLEYYEAYALHRFLMPFLESGTPYQKHVFIKTAHFIYQKL